jgi:predicted dithiol-disulfide oxidoreductase (DUF899 family)
LREPQLRGPRPRDQLGSTGFLHEARRPEPPQVQRKFAASRGWKFPMISHAGNTFAADMGFRTSEGWKPGVSVFQRKGRKIVRVSDASFSSGDDFCTVWHLFDLLPGGAGDWFPKVKY